MDQFSQNRFAVGTTDEQRVTIISRFMKLAVGELSLNLGLWLSLVFVGMLRFMGIGVLKKFAQALG